jgi:sugar (glycoside-pentoside-hexuronide) transporter
MKKVSGLQIFTYSMGALGQTFIYGLMSAYLMIFYTDNVGFSAAVVGTLFLVARIWDAILDPIIGLVVDRSNTKLGKFRPFILAGGILAGIFTVATFFSPQVGLVGKIVYAYITYIIWGTCYGLTDAPYWALSSAMTVEPSERTKIMSVLKIIGMLGVVGAMTLTIPLVTSLGHGNNAKGYFVVSILYGSICIIGTTIAAIFTKERVRSAPKANEKFSDSIKVIFQNPPLIIVLFGLLFYNTSSVIRDVQRTYFFTYVLHNIKLLPLFAITTALPMVISMALTPLIGKKLGKKRPFIIAGLIAVVSCAVSYYFVNNLQMLLILNAFSGVGLGMALVLITSMQGDTVEYAELKTGKRSESIVFSMCTFTMKLATAIGGAMVGYYLTFIGYKPNVEQTPFTINGMNMLMSWIPAIGFLIMVIVISFFPLSEKRHAEIVKELKERDMLEEK